MLHVDGQTNVRFDTPPPTLPLPTRRSVRLEIFAPRPTGGVARGSADETVAKARGDYVRTHFKNMREVAAAVSGELERPCLHTEEEFPVERICAVRRTTRNFGDLGNFARTST